MALALAQVSSTYTERGARVEALREVSLTVRHGEILAIVGPSGCGKSTLLDAIAGLIEPDLGTIALDGVVLPAAARLGRSGYMKQRDLLLPWLTIERNVAIGLELRGTTKEAAIRAAREELRAVDLSEFADRYPAELSGGMRQRAAFARTWVMGRPLVLLDEPFGALDAITRRGLQRWLAAQWATSHPAMVLVTHDIDEALALADRIAVMSPRPGTIRAIIDVPQPRATSSLMLDDPGLRAMRAELFAMLDPAVHS